MIKKSALLLTGLIVALGINSIANAAATATVVNRSNCTCQGFFPDFKSCKIDSTSKGIAIQAENSDFTPYGLIIALGASGPAPIFNNSILINANGPSSYCFAHAGATYFVVATQPTSNITMYTVTDRYPC